MSRRSDRTRDGVTSRSRRLTGSGQRVRGRRATGTAVRVRTGADSGMRPRPHRSSHARRSPYPAMMLVVTILGLALIGWMLTWDHPEPADTPSGAAASASTSASEPERDPTPLFAEQGGTRLYLPVDPSQLTAVAFHQASGERAQHITSLVPDADMTLAAQLKAVPPVPENTSFAENVWNGCALRLWRSNRSGEPDTAADLGAEPGTAVWSPVDGTITEVRPYLLYDAYEDFEIHIKPSGRDDCEIVLIHVTDVVVEAGDRVTGGVTRLASVRKMSDKINIQLGGYTDNGGDHTHMQINTTLIEDTGTGTGGS